MQCIYRTRTSRSRIRQRIEKSGRTQFAFDHRFFRKCDQLAVGKCDKILPIDVLRPDSREKYVLEMNRIVLDFDSNPGHRLEQLLAELGYALNEGPNDFARFLAVINGHQIVDSFCE